MAFLLNEDGTFVLDENGNKIVIEDGGASGGDSTSAGRYVVQLRRRRR